MLTKGRFPPSIELIVGHVGQNSIHSRQARQYSSLELYHMFVNCQTSGAYLLQLFWNTSLATLDTIILNYSIVVHKSYPHHVTDLLPLTVYSCLYLVPTDLTVPVLPQSNTPMLVRPVSGRPSMSFPFLSNFIITLGLSFAHIHWHLPPYHCLPCVSPQVCCKWWRHSGNTNPLQRSELIQSKILFHAEFSWILYSIKKSLKYWRYHNWLP